jgi:hypothetical protein
MLKGDPPRHVERSRDISYSYARKDRDQRFLDFARNDERL